MDRKAHAGRLLSGPFSDRVRLDRTVVELQKVHAVERAVRLMVRSEAVGSIGAPLGEAAIMRK